MPKPATAWKKLCLEIDPGCKSWKARLPHGVRQWQITNGAGEMIAFDTRNYDHAPNIAWMSAYYALQRKQKEVAAIGNNR